jgi:hypothetical protein
VHKEQPQQGFGAADRSGPLKTAALPSDGFQIGREHLANDLPGFVKIEWFHSR